MPDNTTYYREKLTQIMEVPGADSLMTGWYTAATIAVQGEAELKRGTLMTSADGLAFTPAQSAESISAAKEICILCGDIEIPAGETGKAQGYFTGTVSGEMMILPYESENDVHSELLESIRSALRLRGIFLL